MALKKKSKILTPRPYLSWSQLELWEKDPEEYKRRYLYGQTITSQAMKLGKDFAEMLETDKSSDDLIVEKLRIFLAHYPQREFELRAKLKDIPLFGKPDGFDEKILAIGEYKTGRAVWSKGRVDKHGQLTFYALMVWLKYKKLPSDIMLYWCPTEYDEEGTLYLTGEIKPFKTQRILKDILAMIPRIERAWAGIQKLTKEAHELI